MNLRARIDRLKAKAPASVAFCWCMAWEETPEEAADILEAWRDGLEWGRKEGRAQGA